MIYGDFECFLQPDQNDTEEHIPSGFALYTASEHPQYQSDIVVYSGENVMDTFFDMILQEQDRITSIIAQSKPMDPLTVEQWREYSTLTVCPVCETEFTAENYKVRHHNHMTGKFIGGKTN